MTLGTTTTAFSTSGYNYISYNHWSLRQRSCPIGTPNFYQSDMRCYDTCPDGTYPNAATESCLACHFSCSACSSFSVCTACGPLSNRYLNGSSCLPLPGFFENGANQAGQCPNNCATCTSASSCTECQGGFYRTGSACIGCISNCQTCVNGLSCASCSLGFRLTAGSTCTYVCSDANCLDCQSGPSNCTSCSGTYILANGSCLG